MVYIPQRDLLSLANDRWYEKAQKYRGAVTQALCDAATLKQGAHNDFFEKQLGQLYRSSCPPEKLYLDLVDWQAMIERLDEIKLSGEDRQYAEQELMGFTNTIANTIMDIYPSMDFTSASHVGEALGAYAKGGRRRYEVMPGLAQMLRHTEVRGLKMSDFHIPYPGVFLSVPKAAEIYVPGTDYPVECILCGMANVLGQNANRLYMVMASDSARGPEDGQIIQDGVWTSNAPGVLYHVLGMDIQEEERIESFLDRVRGVKTSEHQHLRDAVQWFINAMLYATMPSAEAVEEFLTKEARQLWGRIQKTDPKSKKRKNLNAKLHSVGKTKVVKLGGSIIVDRTKYSESGEGSNGTKLAVRTLVTGHWRMQPYGPQRLLRRRTWIEPFWRGPEDGPVSFRPHILSHAPTNRPEESDESDIQVQGV